MTYTKKDITKALETITAPGEGKSLVESGALKNIVTFDKEIIVDVTISNPTLQAKKKVEVEIMKAIHQHVDQKADVKVNVTAVVPTTPLKPEKPKVPGIQNIIAIASGKGGVGKSTITANMAVSLQKMGFKVGILDADVYGPSTHLMFDVANARPLSVEIDGRSKMQPIESYGVKILSLGFFTDANQAVIWRGAMASKH
jgi:ATP-binding protein involved in chromosome partitioning